MPSEKDNILEFTQYAKSDTMPCIIYAVMESLLMCRDSKNSSTTKISEHILCGYLMSGTWAFHNTVKSILYIVGKILWKSFVLL